MEGGERERIDEERKRKEKERKKEKNKTFCKYPEQVTLCMSTSSSSRLLSVHPCLVPTCSLLLSFSPKWLSNGLSVVQMSCLRVQNERDSSEERRKETDTRVGRTNWFTRRMSVVAQGITQWVCNEILCLLCLFVVFVFVDLSSTEIDFAETKCVADQQQQPGLHKSIFISSLINEGQRSNIPGS